VEKAVGGVVEAAQANDLIFERAIFGRIDFGVVVISAFREPHEMHRVVLLLGRGSPGFLPLLTHPLSRTPTLRKVLTVGGGEICKRPGRLKPNCASAIALGRSGRILTGTGRGPGCPTAQFRRASRPGSDWSPRAPSSP